MLKIALDAKLFASALIKPQSNPGKILHLVQDNRIELILSPSIIKEIKRILLYPKLQKYHQKTVSEIDAYFEDLLIFAWIVEDAKTVEVITDDPSDYKYLTCADEGEADFIVSGDHHLLELKSYKDTKILNPGSFLSLWQNMPDRDEAD